MHLTRHCFLYLVTASLVCLVGSFGVAYAAAGMDALNTARAALNKGDTAAAGAAYKQIGPHSDLFGERLTDLIRWHIQKQDFQEAWRLTEIARRMQLNLPDLDYYRALAVVKHGTCGLALPSGDEQSRRLLHAYMYRFFNRYYGGSYSARPYSLADSGLDEQHLIREQIHYLRDIPRASLLKRKGCRFFYGRFSSRKVAAEYEYKALSLFREEHLRKPVDQQYPIDDVEVRMIELASDQKDDDAVEMLLEKYVHYSADDWARLEPQRAQFLWQKLIQNEMVPPPPYRKEVPQFDLMTALFTKRSPDEGLAWLGLVDWYDIEASKREKLVDFFLEARDERYRPFLLTAKTELLYEQGKMLEALGLVRRLLLLGESNGDAEIERRVSYLATQIFSEYAYSEKILGAVQNAVPAGKWSAVFRSVLLKHAVYGNRRGFQLILKVLKDADKLTQLQLDKEQMEFIESLSERNFAKFSAVLNKWAKARRPKGNALRVITDLTTGIIPLSDAEFNRIKSFADATATFLKAYLVRGEQQVRIQDLLMVYDRARKSEWARGGVSVGASAVAAGHADLRDESKLAPPFTWTPPSRLPLADLILMPDSVGGRSFVLM